MSSLAFRCLLPVFYHIHKKCSDLKSLNTVLYRVEKHPGKRLTVRTSTAHFKHNGRDDYHYECSGLVLTSIKSSKGEREFALYFRLRQYLRLR